jgi:membrane protein implicated in regulation of membrane protease activity
MFAGAPGRRQRGSAILTVAYVVFAVLGCGYVALAVALGHLGDFGGDHGGGHGGHGHDAHGGHGHDAQGHDAHGHHGGKVDYGVAGEGHGVAAASSHAAPHFNFPFFSPLALATLFGSLGAYGLIGQFGLHLGDTSSLLAAVPAAAITSYLVTYAAWRLVTGSVGSSQIRLADLSGAHAEVTTPIPAGGIGEVAAMVDGQRYSGAAREVDGREVPRGAHVTVRGLTGTTLVVIWSGARKEG